MGTTAVVTGGWKGIGRVVAQGLAVKGFDVAVLDIDPAVESMGDLPRPEGAGRLVGHPADVSDPAAVGKAFALVRHQLGAVSIVVNNAGIYPRGSMRETSYADWMRVMAVNAGGAFNCSKALVQGLEADMTGAIVNVSSSIAFEGALRGSHYAASKAAVLGLTRALALELAPRVRVNAVAPGVTDTDQVREGGRGPEELAAFARTEVPLRRLGEPHDVLDLVEFLIGARSSYITGQTIHVNGGAYLW